MKGKKYQYQLVLILDPKTEKKEKVLEKVKSWLIDHKVEKPVETHVGLKELVYEIKKLTKGDFWTYDLDTDIPLGIKELNILLNREINIIRYLILKKE